MVVPESLRVLGRGPRVALVDLCRALAVAVFALAVTAVGVESDDGGLGASEVLLIAVAALALVVRRRIGRSTGAGRLPLVVPRD